MLCVWGVEIMKVVFVNSFDLGDDAIPDKPLN